MLNGGNELNYLIQNLRSYERDMLKFGNSPDLRVMETKPDCWFCGETKSANSREHIFSKTIQRNFDQHELHFAPFTLAARHGYMPHNELGPFGGNSLVVKNVCTNCNNGWMSRLEIIAEKILFHEHNDYVTADKAGKLAQWFMKTAVILNVSQPTKLAWNSEDRKQIMTGPIKNATVHIYRTKVPDLNWMQGSMSFYLAPEAWCKECLGISSSLSHRAVIHVGKFIGVVILRPWSISKGVTKTEGTVIWDQGPRAFTLSRITIAEDIYAPRELIELAESSFFRFNHHQKCSLNQLLDKSP
jgi:hypothetical protein